MEEHRVIRDGDLDLVFEGERIGAGNQGRGGTSGHARDWNRGLDVYIYVTEAKKLVAEVETWSRWEGEDSTHRARVFDTVSDMIAWLRCEDELGPAAKRALEEAVECDQELFDLKCADVERVA